MQLRGGGAAAPVSLGRCHMSASALHWTGARAPSAGPGTQQLLVGPNCSLSPPKRKRPGSSKGMLLVVGTQWLLVADAILDALTSPLPAPISRLSQPGVPPCLLVDCLFPSRM